MLLIFLLCYILFVPHPSVRIKLFADRGRKELLLAGESVQIIKKTKYTLGQNKHPCWVRIAERKSANRMTD